MTSFPNHKIRKSLWIRIFDESNRAAIYADQSQARRSIKLWNCWCLKLDPFKTLKLFCFDIFCIQNNDALIIRGCDSLVFQAANYVCKYARVNRIIKSLVCFASLKASSFSLFVFRSIRPETICLRVLSYWWMHLVSEIWLISFHARRLDFVV